MEMRVPYTERIGVRCVLEGKGLSERPEKTSFLKATHGENEPSDSKKKLRLP